MASTAPSSLERPSVAHAPTGRKDGSIIVPGSFPVHDLGLFKAGVDGYVVKTTEGFELDEQIELALAGGRPVSRFVAGHLLKIDDVAATGSELEHLTPREREVVTLIARGYMCIGRCPKSWASARRP
jgi:hypothetical protein